MEASVAPRSPGTLRVCYFGTYRAEYSRNHILIEGLRRNDVEVIECHAPLWSGLEDRIRAASGGWLRPAFLLRLVKAIRQLLAAHRKVADYDVMILGYPGQIDVFLARLLTWVRRRPLVLDVFMSPYLIAMERGLVTRHRVTGRLIFWLEKAAYRLPDLLIQDTAEYVDWLCHTFKLEKERFRLVPTGADDQVFQPVDGTSSEEGIFRVVYYGSFIPNHGVGTIVEAARMLQDQPGVQFELIGSGPDRIEAERKVREWGLTNVQFTPWLMQSALVRSAGNAHLCLGAFGTTPQSMMTVHNKVFEALAMRLCVVTGDSPSVRRAFVHGQEIWLCQRADPDSLATAIGTLRADPVLRASLAEQGHRAFQARYTVGALGALLQEHLVVLLASLHEGGKQ